MTHTTYSIDLHTHSTASDGTKTPAELVRMAVEYGEKNHSHVVMALTDHDTVAGIEEFLTEAAKYPGKITAIPGLEFSTYYKSETIHILGYGIDIHHEPLLKALAHYRNSRDTRNEKIVQKLQEHGFQITMDDIQPKNPEDSIGRPLMAQHLMKMGYVSSVKEAFNKYLAKGKSCYVDREKPDPEEVLLRIHEAGGIAVLAHPVQYKKLTDQEFDTFVAYLKELGLDGMEIYYSRNSQEETEHFKALADSYSLPHTGGTDYHGDVKPDLSLFIGEGDLNIDAEVLPLFQKYIVKKNC